MKTGTVADSHGNGIETGTREKVAVIDGSDRHLEEEPQRQEETTKKAASFEEAITACGYGKFHYMLLLVMAPVCSAQVFSSATLSLVIPIAECDLQLTNLHKGALNSGVYAGTFIGAFFWGFASDVFGRRKLIIIGLTLDFIFNLLMSLAHTFWLLLLLKVSAGFCITGSTSALSSYVAETHDAARRRRVIMIAGGIAAFFQAVQPAMAYFVIPMQFRYPLIPGVVDFTSWRLFLVLSAIPSILAAVAFYFLPESPKFFMSKGRTAEAFKSLRKIYAINTGNPPSTYPIHDLQTPQKEKTDPGATDGGFLSSVRTGCIQIRPIFRKPYLKSALILYTIQACIMISMNSIRLWVPQLFASLNEAKELAQRSNSTEVGEANTICDLLGSVMPSSSTDRSEHISHCSPISGEVYLRSLIISATAAFSFLISTALIGRIGRKNLAKICFVSAAALVISVNWATNSDIFMGILAVYTAMTRNSFTLMSTITVDVFPTAFRSVAISMGMNCGRIASVAGNLIFPVLLSMGCSVIFFSLGGLLILATCLLWFVSNKTEEL